MSESPLVVHLVDDDPSLRRSLTRLLRAHGLVVEAFESGAHFLASRPSERAGCLVLDLHMPGLNGLELQETLARSGCWLPVVFLTGRGDIPASVQAMKKGAVDFLSKPVDEQVLVEAVRAALERYRADEDRRTQVNAARARLADLTEREHEVMRVVITGALNKQIAMRLGISEKTVKVHRGRVMEKLRVVSVAELVRLCELAGVDPLPI